MSKLVREWLRALGLYWLTTEEDRKEIDAEIEARTGVYCDDAIRMGLIDEEELREMVEAVLRRGKRGKGLVVEVV